MPSRFEPCGLNQMYSQAYGTLPVVHATGGLADSVEDVRVGAEGVSGTGFVMPEPAVSVLQQAVQRALALFAQPEDWRRVQVLGMGRDFGWEGSAREYEGVYRNILAALQRG
jgi:starch synthase